MFDFVLAQSSNTSYDLLDLVDVIARGFNIVMSGAGAIFIVFVVFSAYKFASSQGDPKAYAGAKQSLTYAVMGFLVILGLFVINNIIVDVIGLDSMLGDVNGVFDLIKMGVNLLYSWAGVTTD